MFFASLFSLWCRMIWGNSRFQVHLWENQAISRDFSARNYLFSAFIFWKSDYFSPETLFVKTCEIVFCFCWLLVSYVVFLSDYHNFSEELSPKIAFFCPEITTNIACRSRNFANIKQASRHSPKNEKSQHWATLTSWVISAFYASYKCYQSHCT